VKVSLFASAWMAGKSIHDQQIVTIVLCVFIVCVARFAGSGSGSNQLECPIGGQEDSSPVKKNFQL
jgi:hypothetical protein